MQYKPISYQYAAIDWVATRSEAVVAVVLKLNRWQISLALIFETLSENESPEVDYS